MERIQRLLNLEPRGFRFPAPLLSFGLAFSASLGLAWEPASTFILRHVHPKVPEAVVQPVAREVEGVVAAVREPIAPPVLAELAPVPAPEGNVLADGSTTDLTPLSLSVVPAVTRVREDPKPESISVERLGIPFRSLLGTPFEPWPMDQEQMAATKLPRKNPYLEDALDTPKWGPYAFTTWPISSNHSRRLFRIEVPARSKITFRVEGTSGKKADPYFYWSALPDRSLVDREWVDRMKVKSPVLAVVNPLDVPVRQALVLTGPVSTPYRCVRVLEPLGAEHPIQHGTRVPVEAWPLPGEGVGSVDWATAGWKPAGRVHFGQRFGGSVSPTFDGVPDSDRTGHLSIGDVAYLRCLQVVLAAGEQARFQVEGDAAITLEVAQPSGTEAVEWIKAIEKANEDPKRGRRLMIRNPTVQPQTFVLVMSAFARDRAYRITRVRLSQGDLSQQGPREAEPGPRSLLARLRSHDVDWAAPQDRP